MYLDGEQWPVGPRAGRRVADVLHHANACADWNQVRGLYGQSIQALRSTPTSRPPDEVLGALAEAVFGIAASYVDREEHLAEHVLAVFADVEGSEAFDEDLFCAHYAGLRFYGADTVDAGSRRRPPPYEAVVETCRRLRDATLVRRLFVGGATSGIMAGSTSYGGYFNVYGGGTGRASDLDFVVVLSDARELRTVAHQIAALPGVPDADVDSFRRRARTFAGAYDDQQTVFSHKITLWAEGRDPMLPARGPSPEYQLSLHFLTLPVLRYVLVDSSTRLCGDAAGKTRTVLDYREFSTARSDEQLTFAGRSHLMEAHTEPAQHGYLRRTRVYYIDDTDAYCCGVFQSQLLPPPQLYWDDLGVRANLDAFQRKLRERLRIERSRRPHAMLRASFAHVRRAAFAPHVIRLLDTHYQSG